MFSGSQFESEEKVCRSDMIELLLNAKETVFTVTYRKKVDSKGVETALQGLTSLDLSKNEILKVLTEGDMMTSTCFLTKS